MIIIKSGINALLKGNECLDNDTDLVQSEGEDDQGDDEGDSADNEGGPTQVVVGQHLLDLLGDGVGVQLGGHGHQLLDAERRGGLVQRRQTGGGLPSLGVGLGVVEARGQQRQPHGVGLLVLLAALQGQADGLPQQAGVALSRADGGRGRGLGQGRALVCRVTSRNTLF